MVKSIIIDEIANQALKNILTDQESNVSKSKTGLLIGTIDKTKDYIIHVIPSPLNDESQPSSSQLNDSNNTSVDIDYEWISNHALQIHDMLVGGLDILGLYCIDVSPSIGRQILQKLFKTLNKFDYYKQMKYNTERLLFLVDKTSKNINMKALDVSIETSKPNYLNCEITTQKNLLCDQFLKFNCNFDLNSTFRTPNVKSYNLLKEDFYNALSTEEMFDENRFVCLINNYLVEEKTPIKDLQSNLDKLTDSSSNSNNNELNSTWLNREYDAILMENLTKSKDNKRKTTKNLNISDKEKGLDSLYELTGVCNLIVLLHKSMNTENLKKLLIYDLMRSLYARVRLLVEDLDARKDIIGDVQLEDPYSNDVSAIEESYQTPNRIHIYLDRIDNDKSSLIISDYVFPDETDSDISERIRELFDFEIKDTNKQIHFVEDLPPEIKASQSEDLKLADGNDACQSSGNNSNNLNGPNSLNSSKNQSSGLFNYKLYLGAFLVGAASIFAFYYSYKVAIFLNEDNDELFK